MNSKELQQKKMQQELSGGISAFLVILFSAVSVYGICSIYGASELIPHANFILSTIVFGLGFIIAYARIQYLEAVLEDNDIEY